MIGPQHIVTLGQQCAGNINHGDKDLPENVMVTVGLAHKIYDELGWAWWVSATQTGDRAWTVKLRHDYPPEIDFREYLHSYLRQFTPITIQLQLKPEACPER